MSTSLFDPAASIMSSPLVSLPMDATVGAARVALVDHRIGALPVRDRHGRMAGIVTKTDLVAVTEDSLPVTVFMSAGVHTIDAEATILEAARMLGALHLHHLVVTEATEPVGIISVFDLVGLLVAIGEELGR